MAEETKLVRYPFVDYWAFYGEAIDQLEKAGDRGEAAACAENLVRLFPGSAPAYLKFGELLLKADRSDEADAAFDRGIALDPTYAPIAAAVVKRCCARGDFQRAVQIGRPILEERPEMGQLAAHVCFALGKMGKTAESKELAQAHLAAHPDSAAVRVELLRLLLEAGDPQSGVQLALTQELAAAQPSAADDLARLLLDFGRPAEAVSGLQQIIARGKIELTTFQLYLRALEETGNLSEAAGVAETAFRSVPSPEVGALLRKYSRQLGRSRPKGDRRILMVSELPRVREAKLAYALRPHGWNVTLLHAVQPNFDVKQFFDESHQYTTPEEALCIADRLNIPLHHVFSLRADFTAYSFVRTKLAFTIFDITDVFDGLIYNDFGFHSPQRFCIANADALVCRDTCTRWASKLGGYHRPPLVLYFPEYAWGAPRAPDRSRGDGEIHVVQGGWMDIERFTGPKEGNFGEIIGTLARNGIHVHIYQHVFARSASIQDVYQDFLAIGKQTGCVHVHENVPLERVPAEFQQYDLGLSSVHIHGSVRRQGYHRLTSTRSFQVAGGARITDYIEAGLPVIVSPILERHSDTAFRYGVRIPLTEELLRKPRETLAPFCTPEMRAQVRRRSENFTLERHVPRLIRFYERCLQECDDKSR